MKMSRRSFFYGIASLSAIHLAPRRGVAQISSEGYLTLENESVLLRFDRVSGALCELQNKATKWKIKGGRIPRLSGCKSRFPAAAIIWLGSVKK